MFCPLKQIMSTISEPNNSPLAWEWDSVKNCKLRGLQWKLDMILAVVIISRESSKRFSLKHRESQVQATSVYFSPKRSVWGYRVRNCVRISNNLVPRSIKVSTIDVTANKIFTFGSRTGHIWALSPCPCSPTTPTVHSPTISRFLCKKFPEWPLNFFSAWFTK